MTDDQDDGHLGIPVSELPGHAETRQVIADHVAGSPHPRLAAASVLIAACHVALIWNGREWLEQTLRNWAALLPEIEGDAADDLRGPTQ